MSTAGTMTSEDPRRPGEPPPRLLIVGGDGPLGPRLMLSARACGAEAVSAALSGDDVARKECIDRLFAGAGAVSCVINAPLGLGVDQAEEHPEQAFALYRDGAGLLAQACRERSLPLIHLSSDFVFDGLKTTAYLPLDPVAPLSVLGRSQAEGEAEVRLRLARHVIVRAAWIFGQSGPCFVQEVLRQAAEQEELRIADDHVGCPTYAGDLAGALIKAAVQASRDEAVRGTYHFCNDGAVTWYAFSRRIVALAKSRTRLSVKRILPVLSIYTPRAARRPLCTILDCSTFDATFAVQRRPWSDALREMLGELLA